MSYDLVTTACRGPGALRCGRHGGRHRRREVSPLVTGPGGLRPPHPSRLRRVSRRPMRAWAGAQPRSSRVVQIPVRVAWIGPVSPVRGARGRGIGDVRPVRFGRTTGPVPSSRIAPFVWRRSADDRAARDLEGRWRWTAGAGIVGIGVPTRAARELPRRRRRDGSRFALRVPSPLALRERAAAG